MKTRCECVYLCGTCEWWFGTVGVLCTVGSRLSDTHGTPVDFGVRVVLFSGRWKQRQNQLCLCWVLFTTRLTRFGAMYV